MSYRCQICKAQHPRGKTANKLITKTRPKVYGFGEQSTTGTEIAKEILTCDTCYVLANPKNGITTTPEK